MPGAESGGEIDSIYLVVKSTRYQKRNVSGWPLTVAADARDVLARLEPERALPLATVATVGSVRAI